MLVLTFFLDFNLFETTLSFVFHEDAALCLRELGNIGESVTYLLLASDIILKVFVFFWKDVVIDAIN